MTNSLFRAVTLTLGLLATSVEAQQPTPPGPTTPPPRVSVKDIELPDPPADGFMIQVSKSGTVTTSRFKSGQPAPDMGALPLALICEEFNMAGGNNGQVFAARNVRMQYGRNIAIAGTAEFRLDGNDIELHLSDDVMLMQFADEKDLDTMVTQAIAESIRLAIPMRIGNPGQTLAPAQTSPNGALPTKYYPAPYTLPPSEPQFTQPQQPAPPQPPQPYVPSVTPANTPPSL